MYIFTQLCSPEGRTDLGVDSPWSRAQEVEGIQNSVQVVCLLEKEIVLVCVWGTADEIGCVGGKWYRQGLEDTSWL